MQPEMLVNSTAARQNASPVQQRLTDLFAPLRQPEVRSLMWAQLVSGLGDWAGRLALSVLVYDRSQSALWTAMVTVVSLLPWIGSHGVSRH